ncbi:MAG: L,D-transpeptidase family protein [Chthoniobacteraceae bacterium]
MMNAGLLQKFLGGVCIVFVAEIFVGCTTGDRRVVSIPEGFARVLPVECRQVVFVAGDGVTSCKGGLWMMGREDSSSAWSAVAGPFPVDLGRNGMAWGRGERGPGAPVGFRIKHEGDGCSPVGIFRIPYVFGYAAAAPGIGLRYVPITAASVGVDDGRSRYYNEVVDADKVGRDWRSGEVMLRKDGIYRWGAFVAHNPDNVPGGGSCIFMHIWYGPGHGTSGCTAMAEGDLLRVLRWLDPGREPRLVQVVR